MHKLHMIGALSAVVFSITTTTSYAGLTPKLGGQVVYDDDLNITWTADGNLSASNTFGVGGIASNGGMDWYTAFTWIDAMNSANYLGYNDWRLPDTLQPDASCSDQGDGFSFGTGCTGSEMGHLFNIDGVSRIAPGPFFNVQLPGIDGDPAPTDFYWSSSDDTHDPSFSAWIFTFDRAIDGGDGQFTADKDHSLVVWAVRDGNVATVIDPSATVASGAVIGDGSTVGAGAVIERGVTIGANATIGPNVTINKDVTLGDNTVIGEGSMIKKGVMAGDDLTVGSDVRIHQNVIIGSNVTIGDNSQIHSNTVIGNNVDIGVIGGGVGVFVGNRVTISSGVVIVDGDMIPNDSTVP